MSTQRSGIPFRSAAGIALATAACAFGLTAVPAFAATTIAPHLSCGATRTHVSCLVAPTGGTAPYSVSWNGGAPTSDLRFGEVCGSVFIVTVTVTDNAGDTGSQRQAGLCGPLRPAG